MKASTFLMSQNRLPKLVGLFLLGLILFNFPVIHLFGKDQFVFGIPALYA